MAKKQKFETETLNNKTVYDLKGYTFVLFFLIILNYNEESRQVRAADSIVLHKINIALQICLHNRYSHQIIVDFLLFVININTALITRN